MNSDEVTAKGIVSGDQATIPARIRRELDVNDGDRLRWVLNSDGGLSVEVVSQQTGTFSGFTGYDGDAATDGIDEHDRWGVE